MIFHTAAAETTANPGQALEVYRDLEVELTPLAGTLPQEKIDALLRLLGNSNFLARWARRYPIKAVEVLAGDLETPHDLKSIRAELEKSLVTHPSLDGERLAEVLFDCKYRHMFRISLRDVGLKRPFREVVAEFSSLARAIVQTVLDWQQREFLSDFGQALAGKRSTAPIPFSVLAMGKLGGDELNFSSDIDVLYFYGSDRGRIEKAPDLAPHEYFSKLADRLSAFLRRKSHDGFLYRVDLELRPEGKAGTLVNSLDALEDYYESFGADWEKQAMIRASWAAGDTALCEEFLRRIHPFVYPKLSDFTFLQHLKEMKAKIQESIRNLTQQTFHLKLGEGGIREVEFFVQSLQLLFGGQNTQLQVPNTLEALPRLRDAGLIDAGEAEALRCAYVFLRTMEHRLQLAEEQQTHQMPESAEELTQLARRMGYDDSDPQRATDAMLLDLETHRQAVQSRFNELFSKRYEGKDA